MAVFCSGFLSGHHPPLRKSPDVYLVFDRYEDFSTKSSTRTSRMAEGCKVYQLSLMSPLPSQKVALTITQNKKQLIDIICKDLQNDAYFQENTGTHKLMITAQEKSPTEISCGVVIQRHDIATTHEKADSIIVQQAVQVAVNEQKYVTILADDTDVYALIIHYYLQEGLQSPMVMESPIKDRKIIDIRATVEKHHDIIPAGHALTGCDTVAACYGVGKGKMLKVLRKHVASLVTFKQIGLMCWNKQ